MSDLNRSETKALGDLTDAVGRILRMHKDSIQAMKSQVIELGTDHEDGAIVDAVVEATLGEAISVKER